MRLLPAAASRQLRLQMDVVRVKLYRFFLFDDRHFLRLEEHRLFLFGDWRFLRCGWLENLVHLRFLCIPLHLLSKVEVLHRDKSICDVLFLQKRLLLCLLPGKSGLARVAHPFFMQVGRQNPPPVAPLRLAYWISECAAPPGPPAHNRCRQQVRPD